MSHLTGSLVFFLYPLKLVRQFVNLFHDFGVVSLDISAG